MTQLDGTRVVVAKSEDLPEGGRRVVAIEGHEIGIFRIDGELHAWENYCVHAGGPVCQGLMIQRIVEVLDDEKRSLGDDFSPSDLHIVCPWHGYEYNVRTGEHPADPRIRLRAYPVFEREGVISVEL